MNFDDLVKSPSCPIFVIPAKAGIQIHIFLSALGGLLSQSLPRT